MCPRHSNSQHTQPRGGPPGARALLRTRSSHTARRDSNGKSDPFVEITVGKKKKKTKTKMRTRDPVWNEEFIFDIWSIQDKIALEIFDWDAVGDNDLLGRKTIELAGIFVGLKDGKGPGEGRFKLSQSHKLEGLDGTVFVDAEQTERVQGSNLIEMSYVEMSYVGDPSLLEKVGILRLVTNYVVPAKTPREAAEMEMALYEAGDDAPGYDPWDEKNYDTIEQQIMTAMGPKPKACLSKARLTNSTASFNLSDASLDQQMSIFKSNGGQVATAKQKALVRSRPTTDRPPTIWGAGMRKKRQGNGRPPQAL